MIDENGVSLGGQNAQIIISRFLQAEMHPGETRRAFARRLGLRETTMTRLLIGRRPPTENMLGRLQAIFGDCFPPMLGAGDDHLPVADAAAPPQVHGPDGETLTSPEAAAMLGISEARLMQLKAQNNITPVSPKHHVIRYPRSDVEALREERARAGLPEIHHPRQVRDCARAGCNQKFRYRHDNPQNFCSPRCRDTWLVGRAIPKYRSPEVADGLTEARSPTVS